MKYSAEELLRIAVEQGASDLHLTPQAPATLRIDGKLVPIRDCPVLSPDQVQELASELMDDKARRRFDQDGEADFSIGVSGVARFRCHVYRQRGTCAITARAIPSETRSFTELGLPPILKDLCYREDGLILVTGPTGSGKSTTLAAMIEEINRNRSCVVVTLEDPIEYLHKHKQSLVNQREVGGDTRSFAAALRAAMRADPDVILVGEMRDLETIQTVMTAAETGHLVLSTLHTRSAAETVNRIVDAFPPHQQAQIRMQLASVLQAALAQKLVPKVGGGRIPLVEVLVGTVAVRNLIREGRTHQIPAAIETGRRFGMQTFDDAMKELKRQGLIDRQIGF